MPGERGEPHRPAEVPQGAGQRYLLIGRQGEAAALVTQSFNLLPAGGFQFNQALRNEPLQTP